ncbi:choice-of-anchor L domain-containing protein [Flavobacterium rhizosphaerae]|uniref:Choice-of-anchor L domain-containing protein n=1 Tax=Flavobacterium rhizosphaerae TaxID=3163298 RepID=A0ABW8YWJ4_9FLAO
MNLRPAYKVLFSLLFIAYQANAQYIEVDDTYTPQQLVQDVLVNSTCAVVSNVSVSGGNFTNGSQSFGYFSGSGTTFPFQNGIILSTGRAVGAEGPNTSLLDDGGNIAWGGDSDLEQALQLNNSINATLLEFDFVPLGNRISFDYMLSSEEYHDNAPCNYSDGFAFLLREAGSTAPYQNLAVIPGTNIPVKVTSVHPQIGGNGGCPAQNEQYFGAFNGTQHPTNFNGQTAVLTAVADVQPGVTYHIKLVIADEGNYRYDSAIFLGGGSFDMATNLGPDRLVANGNPLCSGELYTLDATSPNATGYQWYKNGVALATETSATYTVTAAGEYSVEVTFTPTCSSDGEVTIEYVNPPALGTYTLLQCDDDTDGFTAYNLEFAGRLATGNNQNFTVVAYYESMDDAINGTNPITTLSPYNNTIVNQPIYITVLNQFGCLGVATAVLSTSANTVNNPDPLEICDTDGTDDGMAEFDLTTTETEILNGLPNGLQLEYYTSYTDALTLTNSISQPDAFVSTVSGTQMVYARITNADDCYGIAEITLVVRGFNGVLNDEEAIICQGETLTLDAGNGFASYSWNDGNNQQTQFLTVTEPGSYTVTLGNAFGCTSSKTFKVLPSGAATAAQVVIDDFHQSHNSVTLIPAGRGDYEYSANGITYQQSPVFENLPAGPYVFYIRDKNGCEPVLIQRAYILNYPKFFTPNGDNSHETWRIPFMEKRPDIRVLIFDRYGKLITGFGGNSTGWDGTFNGHTLPADDYWFTIQLEDNKIIRGHFALIR